MNGMKFFLVILSNNFFSFTDFVY